MKNKPLLIVGLDPGTTAAYALLDLHGNIIDIQSQKNKGLSHIIFSVIQQGIPVITATDVSLTPHFVHEFHRKTGTKLITPDVDLQIKEKKLMTNDIKLKNKHEMDALAAARYALNKQQSLLKRIDNFLRKRNKPELSWNMKKIVLTQNLCPEAVYQQLM
jgi:uncharacterized protein